MRKVKVMYANRDSKWLYRADETTLPTISDMITDYTQMCEIETEVVDDDLLEHLFGILNSSHNPLGKGQRKDAQAVIAVTTGHTSMSSGDILIIDNVAYIAMMVGWMKMDLTKMDGWKEVD